MVNQTTDVLPTDVNPNRYPKHADVRKGQVFNGECNRTACDRYGARYWNMGTYGLYCLPCSLAINRVNLQISPLCIEVKEKPKLEEHEAFKDKHGYYVEFIGA